MLIAVASGKGGTGKTFVSTNLYRSMEMSGADVSIVDCDAEVPNASLFIRPDFLEERVTTNFLPEISKTDCTFCGACASACRFHAVVCVPGAKYISVMPELCHGCRVCAEVCPSGAVGTSSVRLGKVSVYGTADHYSLLEARTDVKKHSPVPVIRHALKTAAEVPSHYTLLDAPPGCSCPFVNTVLTADLVVLVTEPTPFGLSDLKQTVEVLRALEKRFAVIVNRSDLGDGRMRDYLAEEGIEVLAEIPYSRKIASFYAGGRLAVEQDAAFRKLFDGIFNKIRNYETCGHQR